MASYWYGGRLPSGFTATSSRGWRGVLCAGTTDRSGAKFMCSLLDRLSTSRPFVIASSRQHLETRWAAEGDTGSGCRMIKKDRRQRSSSIMTGRRTDTI